MKKFLLFIAGAAVLYAVLFLSANNEVISQGSWSKITFSIQRNFMLSSYVAGSDTFTTSALRDTIVFTSGTVRSTDRFVVSMVNDSTPVAWGPAKNDSLIVLRKSGGTAGARWTYFRWVPK